jgi:hypothetical protein
MTLPKIIRSQRCLRVRSLRRSGVLVQGKGEIRNWDKPTQPRKLRTAKSVTSPNGAKGSSAAIAHLSFPVLPIRAVLWATHRWSNFWRGQPGFFVRRARSDESDRDRRTPSGEESMRRPTLIRVAAVCQPGSQHRKPSAPFPVRVGEEMPTTTRPRRTLNSGRLGIELRRKRRPRKLFLEETEPAGGALGYLHFTCTSS